MNRFRLIPFELLFLVLASQVSAYLAAHHPIIPQSILERVVIALRPDEVRTLMGLYVGIHLPIFLFTAWRDAKPFYANPDALVRKAYACIFGATLVSLASFLFTTVSFTPDFFATMLLFALGGLLAVYAAMHTYGSRLPALGRQRGLPATAFASLRAPLSVAIIVFAASPVALAFWYKNSDAVVNTVSGLRMFFNGEAGLEYALVDAFPDVPLHTPMMVTQAGNDPSDLYVLERDGRIVRIADFRERANERNAEELLEFRSLVGDITLERGAMGMALHPEFGVDGSDKSGYAYVFYTRVVGEEPHRLRVSRFDLSLPNKQDRFASELRLIEIQRNRNGYHNAGGVIFGPDGFLYISVGEAADTRNHQSIERSLFSAILRIDVDRRGGAISHPIARQPINGKTQGYFIPSDNPFVGRENALEEFYALGLRNPFRFTFDSETGDMWLGDVGQNEFEEVNKIVPGSNCQYSYAEGYAERPHRLPAEKIGIETPPVFVYAHTAYDRAVVGADLYRGKRFPELHGRFLYGDSMSAKLMSLDVDANPPSARPLARTNYFGQMGVSSVSALDDGSVVFTVMGPKNRPGGKILELVRASSVRATAASAGDTPAPESTGMTASQLYLTYCARCHGESGDGRGDSIGANDVQPRDLRTPAWHDGVTDDEIYEVIAQGGTAVGLSSAMPAWDEAFNAEEIRSLTVYVRSLRTE